MAAVLGMDGATMTRDEIATRLAAWLDGVVPDAPTALKISGYFQCGADRLFPEVKWGTVSTGNTRTAIAVCTEISLALSQRRIAAVAMVILTLKSVSGNDIAPQEIVLSSEIDALHPPLFYVLRSESHLFAPRDFEVRVPLALPEICPAHACAFLLARPSDPSCPALSPLQEWDRDVRIVLFPDRKQQVVDCDGKPSPRLLLG